MAQVALSVVLLLGAGLLTRTFVKLVSVDLGFDPRNLLVIGVALPRHHHASANDQARFYRQAIDRIRSIPGVLSVAISSGPPPFAGMPSALQIAGAAVPEQSAFVVFCSESLLDAVGLTLVKGRQLSGFDVGSFR